MPKTETKLSSDTIPENEPEIEHQLNYTEAVNDLTESGCVFTEYTGTYSRTETIKLDYQQFKEEAINRKIVFTAERSHDVPVLLVIREGNTYEWSP